MARRAPAREGTKPETPDAGAAPDPVADADLTPATQTQPQTQDELEAEIARLEAEDAAATAAAPAAAAAPTSGRDTLFDAVISDEVATLLRIRNAAQRRLLAEACYVFGITPDPRTRPTELASHRFEDGDAFGPNPTPPSVIIATSGGLKIRYPIDDETENRLRIVYGAYRINKATGAREELPLPPDLTLPRENIDGQVRSRDHQYRTGYVREGGAAAADRRASALDALRRKGSIR